MMMDLQRGAFVSSILKTLVRNIQCFPCFHVLSDNFDFSEDDKDEDDI